MIGTPPWRRLKAGALALAIAPTLALARVADTITDPHWTYVSHIQRQVGKVKAGFQSFIADGTLFVPLIVLPHLFDVTYQWTASQQTLALKQGPKSLTFRLGSTLGVQFAGQTVDLGAPLHHHQGMLYLPIRVVASFFKKKATFDKRSGVLGLLPAPERSGSYKAPPPAQRSQWEKTLAQSGSLAYAEKLEASSQGKQVFRRIWGTSEEAQSTAGPGIRGDFFLRDSDLAGALPSKTALGRYVTVRYPKTGKSVTIRIVDVGPWNIDDPYWVKSGGRPAVETKIYDDFKGRKSNLAGIDLSYETWVRLGLPYEKAYGGNHSDYVDWWFAD